MLKNIRESQYRNQNGNLAQSIKSTVQSLKNSRLKGKSSNMESLYKQKKFGDDMLAELSYARFNEAKKRLRHFVIHTDMVSDQSEKTRLINFFQHR